jgi:stage V sporulation protein S
MRECGHAEIQAIGASAVNQAMKAITIARGYLEGDNIDLVVVPGFHEVDIDGKERTALRLHVEHQTVRLPYQDGNDGPVEVDASRQVSYSVPG